MSGLERFNCTLHYTLCIHLTNGGEDILFSNLRFVAEPGNREPLVAMTVHRCCGEGLQAAWRAAMPRDVFRLLGNILLESR